MMILGVASPVHAATGDACNLAVGTGGLSGGLIEITPWYKYLNGKKDVNDKCRPEFPRNNSGKVDIAKSSTLIIVAIIELLTRVAGLIAAGYIIYGGIQYIMSQGEPEGLANAKNTITNALIGFVIIVLAIALVQFVGRAFK